MDAFDAARVADHFQLGCPAGALQFVTRGQRNPLGVCRLETDKGCYAVKRFDTAPTAASLAIETAASKAGLPMPKPIRTPCGQLSTSYQAGGQTLWIRVYRWVPGATLDWGCVNPGISLEIGKLMAAIHRLPVAAEDLLEEPSLQWSVLTESGWAELAESASARRMLWAEALHRAIPVLIGQEAYLIKNSSKDEVAVPSQRDLHPPNIVRTPASAFFVIDWDSAGPVVDRHDVAKFALVWATPKDGQPLAAAVHAFIDGYRECGGRYQSQGPTDLLYQQKTLHWWLVFNIRRDLSDRPGPDTDLTSALLQRVVSWDTDRLQSLADLLDY